MALLRIVQNRKRRPRPAAGAMDIKYPAYILDYLQKLKIPSIIFSSRRSSNPREDSSFLLPRKKNKLKDCKMSRCNRCHKSR